MDRKNKVMEIEIRTTLGRQFYVGLAGCSGWETNALKREARTKCDSKKSAPECIWKGSIFFQVKIFQQALNNLFHIPKMWKRNKKIFFNDSLKNIIWKNLKMTF